MSGSRLSAWELWSLLPSAIPHVKPYRRLGAVEAQRQQARSTMSSPATIWPGNVLERAEEA